LTELAFIALGSNIDPETNLPLAASRLSELGNPIAISTVYQNPAIADELQPDYLNAFAPRTIDLDLCILGDRVLDHELLSLPDPDLLKRAHLAVTLAELRPDFLHPITGDSLEEIAHELKKDAELNPRSDVVLQSHK
jgi:7,8-dihydro-6-hydroxymethylpterin-pyrophosphokinase